MSFLADLAHIRGRRALAIFACIGVVVGFWLVAFASTAQAHPSLLRSVPADGETVRKAPQTIELWFAESVDSTTVHVEVYDGDGRKVVSVGSPKHDVGNVAVTVLDQGTHLRLSQLPDLSPSVYEVRWSVISRLDLHRLRGTVVFGFDRSTSASGRSVTPDAGALPDVAQIVLGWADLVGIALMCGGLLLVIGLVPWVRSRARPAADLFGLLMRSVPLFVMAGGCISLASATCLLVTQANQGAAVGDSTWNLLMSSGHAARWVVRQTAVLSVLLLLARRTRHNDSGWPPWADLLFPVLIAADLAARATTSHAGSGVASASMLTVHELAALTWVGGLAVLVVATLHLRGQPGGRSTARELMIGFGLAAAVCVALMVATGFLLAGRQVATVDAALRTTYGWALMSKLVLVALAMALGLRHTLHLHRWMNLRRTRGDIANPSARSLAVEAAVALTVVALAAVLAGTQPARGPQFTPASLPSGPMTQQLDDMLITFSLRPNRPGRNLLIVDVYDERRPTPGPVVSITATAGSIREERLQPSMVTPDGNGRWQSTIDIDSSDALPFEVVVSREGLAATTLRGAWTMPRALPTQPVLVSRRPLRPWTDAGAVATLAIAALLAGWLARRRRRILGAGHPVAPLAASRPLAPVGAAVMRR